MRQLITKSAAPYRPKFLAKLDYPAQYIGQTKHVQVYDGANLNSAHYVLKYVEKDYDHLANWFGRNLPTIVTIVVAPLSASHDGSGGAYHQTCADEILYCDVDNNNPVITEAFAVAEMAECFSAMAPNMTAWNCGASMGEGLSRVLAEAIYPATLNDFETVSSWLNSPRNDWITQTDQTDQSAESTGCSVLFLWWLHSVKKVAWWKICQAPGQTLSDAYKKITGKSTALQEFMEAVNQKWSPGSLVVATKDNIWV